MEREYLRYGSKGSRPVLSISKIKATYYPDVGLEKMVPDQLCIEEECKHASEGDRRAVRTHMQILSVVRIEVFSMYGEKYGVQMIMRFNEIHKFSDGTLHQIDEALDYRVKEFKVNRMNPGLNTRFWTRKDVDRSKEVMFAIQKRLKTKRIFRNLESFVGRRDISTSDPFLNKLCSARIMFRGTTEYIQTETPLIDPDENQIDVVNKVKSGVHYPAFDPDIPWDKMQPILGMRYETPQQLKLALANYGVANGYQLWYMKNAWREVLVYYGRDVEEGRCAGKKGNKDRVMPNKVRSGVKKKVVKKQTVKKKVVKNQTVKKTTVLDSEEGTSQSTKWTKKQIQDSKKIKQLDEGAYDCLIQKNPNSWSRAFFEMDRRCAAFENGISESFNKAILITRHKPIITMLEEIRLYIMQRLVAMNKASFSLEDRITPSIRKREWTVFPSGFEELEIRKGDHSYGVNLQRKVCQCRMWELSGVSCVHVVAAYFHVGKNLDLGVSHWGRGRGRDGSVNEASGSGMGGIDEANGNGIGSSGGRIGDGETSSRGGGTSSRGRGRGKRGDGTISSSGRRGGGRGSRGKISNLSYFSCGFYIGSTRGGGMDGSSSMGILTAEEEYQLELDEEAFRECMEEQAREKAKIDVEQERLDKERREEQEMKEMNDYFNPSNWREYSIEEAPFNTKYAKVLIQSIHNQPTQQFGVWVKDTTDVTFEDISEAPAMTTNETTDVAEASVLEESPVDKGKGK
nr:hypothetical protein [Tanacetum cinerariifolium]